MRKIIGRKKRVLFSDVEELLSINEIDLSELLSKPSQQVGDLTQEANNLQRSAAEKQKSALAAYQAAMAEVASKQQDAAHKAAEAGKIKRLLAKFRR